jgi:hypothetical protein
MAGMTGRFVGENLEGIQERAACNLLLYNKGGLLGEGLSGEQLGHGNSLFDFAGGAENRSLGIEDAQFPKAFFDPQDVQKIMDPLNFSLPHEVDEAITDQCGENLEFFTFGIEEVFFLILDDEIGKERHAEGDHPAHG